MGSIGSDGVDRDRLEFCRRNCTAGYHDDPQCYWAGSANTVTYQSGVFCEHANECPTSVCRCNIDCACREHMCKLPDLAAHNERCNHWLGKQCTCRYRAGGMTMGEEKFSIQDAKTGAMWCPPGTYSTSSAPIRFSYVEALSCCKNLIETNPNIRIVPAPMSEADCLDWLKASPHLVIGWSRPSTSWWVTAANLAGTCVRGQAEAIDANFFEAIRKAKK